MDVCEAMVCVPECGVLTFVDGQSGEGRITGEPCPCRTNEGRRMPSVDGGGERQRDVARDAGTGKSWDFGERLAEMEIDRTRSSGTDADASDGSVARPASLAMSDASRQR